MEIMLIISAMMLVGGGYFMGRFRQIVTTVKEHPAIYLPAPKTEPTVYAFHLKTALSLARVTVDYAVGLENILSESGYKGEVGKTCKKTLELCDKIERESGLKTS